MRLWDKLKVKIRRYTLTSGYACDGCGAEVFDYPTHRLCACCESRLLRNDKSVCKKCGRQTVAMGVCLTCKGHLPKFTEGYAPFVYRADVASLVNRLKNSSPMLALYFGEQMADYFFKTCNRISNFKDSNEELLILPVPITKTKRLERGYNQAEELAKRVYERLKERGLNVELTISELQKTKDTLQQKHMDSNERRKNVEGAYHIENRQRIQGKTILLIDDILTTGATGSECAKRLFTAGAKEVFFLVAASLPERK